MVFAVPLKREEGCREQALAVMAQRAEAAGCERRLEIDIRRVGDAT